MKGVTLFSAIGLTILSLFGCQTVPRHLVREEVVIIYYEPIYVDPIYTPEPPSLDPPTKPITNPKVDNPPPRNLQSDNLNNGGSYGTRDPLRRDSIREPGKIKSDPPVRKPKQNGDIQ